MLTHVDSSFAHQKDLIAKYQVTVTGSGDRTLVFAHGFGTDQTAWSQQVRAFSGRYRIVLFNLPGAVENEQYPFNARRYSNLYVYAQDFIEILRGLQLLPITLIGHSVSGMIGILASVLAPELFSSLILIGASPRYLNDGDYHGGFEQRDMNAIYESMSTNYHAWAGGFASLAMGNPDRPEFAEGFARSLRSIRPDIAQSIVRTIFQSDHRADLARVSAPVFVVQSSEDVAVPGSVGAFLAARLPRGRLVNLTASGHLPHISAAAEVNRAIADCLES